jgi:hypothetical protein
MLLHFRESLVLPYADALRGLKPLSTIGQARRGPRST